MIWDAISKQQQEALHAEQELLEMFSLDAGIARYREDRRSNVPSNGTPEQKLIASSLSTLIPAVERLQEAVSQGNAIRGVTHWGYPLLSLPADKLAFLSLAEIINHADTLESTTTSIASAIGSRAKIEREFATIRNDAPDVYARVKKRNKKWTRRAHRTAQTKAGMVDAEEWSPSVRAWLGITLLELAVEYTNILVVQRTHIKGKSRVVVSLNPEVRRVLEQAHSQCELLRPFHLPMVVPPCDWGDQKNGGYRYHRMPLVKPSVMGANVQERDAHDMPLVLQSINTLQRTEWCINQPILLVQSAVWDSGGHWAGLPPNQPLQVPKPDFDWDSAESEKKAEWKLKATRIHDENARLGSKRKAILHKLWIAKRFSGFEVIYFPHQLDWRGREYPSPSHLHPQADDPARALLRFARGKTLGLEGLYWLKIHLANCYGMDKVPFTQRVAWVDANSSHIRQSAKTPLDYRWWADGDDPWQTLAACMEVAEATEYSLSYLPGQQDGSCNGLQHFSAMGRDVVGAIAVNLIPSDKPNDVYQQVADRVNVLIEEDLCSVHNSPHLVSNPIPLEPLSIMNGSSSISIDISTGSKESNQGLGSANEECSSPNHLAQQPESSKEIECTDLSGMNTNPSGITMMPVNDISPGLKNENESASEKLNANADESVRPINPDNRVHLAGISKEVECPLFATGSTTGPGFSVSSLLDEDTLDHCLLSSSSTPLASAICWQGQINRAVVKRATMTIVYGLTRQGMRQQFIDDGHCDSLEGNLNQNASYLRDKTWQALEGVLTGASAIMEWLRIVAQLSAAAGHSVRWHTPVGFFVIQEYLEPSIKHLYTAMQKLTIVEPNLTGKLSEQKQIRGLPPNFVHSMDAAHMMLTTIACAEAGITDLSMIHDSYGCHMADIPKLNRILREQFVKMYTPDRLTEIWQEWCKQTSLDLPPPPTKGELKLEQVLDSPYFFA